MPAPRDAEKMKKAEKEVGDNIPSEMIGLDTEDVGDVDGDVGREARGARREGG